MSDPGIPQSSVIHTSICSNQPPRHGSAQISRHLAKPCHAMDFLPMEFLNVCGARPFASRLSILVTKFRDTSPARPRGM